MTRCASRSSSSRPDVSQGMRVVIVPDDDRARRAFDAGAAALETFGRLLRETSRRLAAFAWRAAMLGARASSAGSDRPVRSIPGRLAPLPRIPPTAN